MINSVFLSLGSNEGNKMDNLNRALLLLKTNEYIDIKLKSNIYETTPMYNSNQRNFYNMVIKINTKLNPLKLLEITKYIEISLGRKITKKINMPRMIDIDILTFNDIAYKTNLLIIPHNKLAERKFVLLPWEEIASNFYISKYKKSVKELLSSLNNIDEVKKLN